MGLDSLTFGQVRTLFVSSLLLITCTYSNASVDLYDGFEDPILSNIWNTDRMEAGAFRLQSAVVRSGKQALQITLHPGDRWDRGDSQSQANERDELGESLSLQCQAETTYEFSFSIFLPPDFPIVSTRLVLAQWKQRCPVDTCEPNSPVVALRYSSGEMYITIQTEKDRTVLYRTADDIRNRWLDFRFNIRFSRQESGILTTWLNDHQIVEYNGITAYAKTGGYEQDSSFYFKIGLYRDSASIPMTVFVDEFRMRSLSDPAQANQLPDPTPLQ